MGVIHRLVMLGPDDEPLWVRLGVRPGGDHSAASIVADAAEPPRAGELKGTGFFGGTPTEAKELALRYGGGCVEQKGGRAAVVWQPMERKGAADEP